MTPRSFWKILLKIAGLWLFVQSLPTLMLTVSQVFIYVQDDFTGIYGIFFALLTVALSLGCFYLLIFKTEWIVTKLRLDKGFTEDAFTINMHRSSILTIAVTVIGAMMLIDSIPLICQQIRDLITVSGFERNISNHQSDYTWLVFYIAKALIGVLLMIYCRDAVNFIELKRKGSASNLFIEPTPETKDAPEENNEILKDFESDS